jgi:predicted O-methyltransferase YrrM
MPTITKQIGMKTTVISSEIQQLETYSKQGDSYTDNNGRYGWRNPIRTDTGSLLTGLVISTAPKHILEIGTGHGLSTLYLASGLEVPYAATIDSIEFDPGVAASTQARMNDCKAPVTVHTGDALDVIAQLEGYFDLVFLDAQKNMYLSHLLALMARNLIGAGTVILADNVVDRQVECQSFLDWFVDEGINHEIIPTECGLLVARL